jgi:PAS domain S-box-containing protein
LSVFNLIDVNLRTLTKNKAAAVIDPLFLFLMRPITNKTISLLAIPVIAISLFIAWLLEDNKVMISGFAILIVLTSILPGSRSTLLTGIGTMVIITLWGFLFPPDHFDILQQLLVHLYMLSLASFAMVFVFYYKRVQENYTIEKTHMTSLFENATEGILLTNRKGVIVMANPAAERMFAYQTGELDNLLIEQLIPQRFHHNHESHRDGFYHKPQNRHMGIGRDLYARRKDNSEFPVEISLSYYQQNEETFVIAFIVDITSRKEIENKLISQREELEKVTDDMRVLNTELEGRVEERTIILKEALEKLEVSQLELSSSLDKERQLNEIKSRFVSMASHEFRTPLSTILSSATLIAKYPATDDQDKREKHIGRIKDSVKHLNELLEDFLSLGKLEEGKVSISTVQFSVPEFIDDIVDEVKVQLKKDQKIDYSCSGPAVFNTDKRMLKNILLNLLSNGIKFSGEGKVISLETYQEHHQLKIVIKDQGIGIPEEDQQHLFTTFFRAANASNIQGTGLGLTIIKRYVNLLHGEIGLQSVLEEGTTITVKLPSLRPDGN